MKNKKYVEKKKVSPHYNSKFELLKKLIFYYYILNNKKLWIK